MLKIMGSILVFAAAAGMAGTYKENWQTIWHFCTRCGNFWWIFPVTEMEPDSRWKFCWDAL